MNPHAIALIVVLFQVSGLSAARAQDASGLRIVVQVKVGRQDGGDRRSTGGFIDPGAIGKTVAHVFSRLTGQCGTAVGPAPLRDLGVASDGSIKRVESAWTVQTTPTRLAGEAATFRVQWTRTRDNGKPSTVGDDTELTLRPGQALTLDLMPQSDDASGACVSLSLSVGVVYWPEPDADRRLLGVDLWLVERLPDGKERSQPQSLRGLYNHPIPFHFDTVSTGTKTLDVFGNLPDLAGDGDDRDQNHHAKPGDRPRAVAASRWLPGGSALASSTHRLDNGDAAGRSGRGRVSAARASRPRRRRCRGVCRARPVVQNPGPPDSVKGV